MDFVVIRLLAFPSCLVGRALRSLPGVARLLGDPRTCLYANACVSSETHTIGPPVGGAHASPRMAAFWARVRRSGYRVRAIADGGDQCAFGVALAALCRPAWPPHAHSLVFDMTAPERYDEWHALVEWDRRFGAFLDTVEATIELRDRLVLALLPDAPSGIRSFVALRGIHRERHVLCRTPVSVDVVSGALLHRCGLATHESVDDFPAVTVTDGCDGASDVVRASVVLDATAYAIVQRFDGGARHLSPQSPWQGAEVFDLCSDPDETDDLCADDHWRDTPLARDLRRAYIGALRTAGALSPYALDDGGATGVRMLDLDGREIESAIVAVRDDKGQAWQVVTPCAQGREDEQVEPRGVLIVAPLSGSPPCDGRPNATSSSGGERADASSDARSFRGTAVSVETRKATHRR